MSTKADRVFFVGFSVMAACTVFAGFSPTFYLRPAGARPLSAAIVLHAVVFTSWIVLMLAQTLLIASRRTNVHRRLGVVGGLLALAMLVLGVTTAVAAARRGYVPGANSGMTDALGGFIIPLRDITLFITFVAGGLYYRADGATHKRLMMLATINLLPAALGRLPVQGALVGAAILAFALLGPAYDLVTHRRIHWVSLWGGALTVVSSVGQFPVARTETWHRIALWLTS